MSANNCPKSLTMLGACGTMIMATLAATMTATAAPVTDTSLKPSAPIYYGEGGKYPFSAAVRVGDTLYLSGQMGIKDGKLVKGGVKTETQQTLDNIRMMLQQYGYAPKDLVKCSAMLTDMDDYKAFNSVYQSELNPPYPVRSAFAVSELALGASVMIECMAAK